MNKGIASISGTLVGKAIYDNVRATTRFGGRVDVGIAGRKVVVSLGEGSSRRVFAASLVKNGWKPLPSNNLVPGKIVSDAAAAAALEALFAEARGVAPSDAIVH